MRPPIDVEESRAVESGLNDGLALPLILLFASLLIARPLVIWLSLSGGES